MVKILSRSGDSLADVYDVVGSVAGIEELRSEEVTLVHEMGQTLFSERLSGFIRRSTTGAITQSTFVDEVLTDLPNGITKVVGVQVFADDASRVDRMAVMLRSAVDGDEIPLWVWDGANNVTVRFSDNGAAVATHEVLVPSVITQLPSLLIGRHQPQRVDEISLRGQATAFGAGNVTITMLVYIAFTHLATFGLSSRGLPVPSW